MIDIEAILEADGTLIACSASGHANAGKTGSDIVCAAVSVLMRTAASALFGRKGITVRSSAPERGQMLLEVEYEAEGKEFLFAIGVFLVKGLSSVAEEFPKNCKFSISTYNA